MDLFNEDYKITKPYQDKDSWCSISNVECEIKMDKPMIYITAKTVKE